VCGNKFYDGNGNAIYDDTESGIDQWRITITGNGITHTVYTENGGGFDLSSLQTGEYTVCEAPAVEDNWIQTTPPETCYTVQVPSAEAEACTLDFGNLCLGAGGGHTPGFWSNENGAEAFNSNDNGAASLALVNLLFLVDDTGASFDAANHAELAQWLLYGDAVNMSYMLSVHLAAMALNVEHGFVDGDALVFAPGAISANYLGFMTVDELIAEANAALMLYPYTPDPHQYREYAELLKNALDDGNNDRNFVQEAPCEFTFDE
jgi:hypothetical protein